MTVPPPLVSILIPTIGNRADLLAQVTRAFREQLADEGCEVLTITGHTWGEGLNRLARRAAGAYWMCICDDTLPHEGWFSAASHMLEVDGWTPASRYFHRDGQPLRPGVDDAPHGAPIAWCRSFLLTPDLYAEVGPFIDTTWWADINYSERLEAAGYPVRACDGFSFTHLDGSREWLTVEAERRERGLYEAWAADES